MLPESLLKFSRTQGIIAPHYLDERDHPWLRLLIQEFQRFVGCPQSKLVKHLRSSLPFLSPLGKRQLAIYVLNREFRSEVGSRVSPRKLRKALFEAAAPGFDSRESVMISVAATNTMDTTELEASLFSDLPSERRVAAPVSELSASEIALRANSLLVQGFLGRALSVRIELEGNARAVVRQAKLRGLICQAKAEDPERKMSLIISGPFALFRRTLLYGRSLGELVPPLIWCHQFRLTAKCVLAEKEHLLVVSSGDPIFPSKAPREFDSKVEEVFAKQFQKIAPDWDLIREPKPVTSSETLIFPDFLLRSRKDPQNSWLLEIIGFWTTDYLQKKLQRLKAANVDNLILCINGALNCADGDFPTGANVIHYRNKIDPNDVLRIVENGKSQPSRDSA